MKIPSIIIVLLLCINIHAQHNLSRQNFERDFGHAPEKELVEKRDLQSKTFKNDDGSFTSVVSTGPLHYQENGSYHDFDLRIERMQGNSPYRYANEKNKLKSYFSMLSGNGISSVHNGHAVQEFLNLEYFWEKNGQRIAGVKANDVLATTQLNELTYPGLYPFVDAVFTILPSHRALNYILKDRTALTNAPHDADYLVFSEDILIQQDWITEQVNNEIIVQTKTGELVTRYTAPFVTEGFGSHGKESINGEVVNYELHRSGSVLTVLTKVSAAWLLDASRIFPLAIDPTANLNPENIYNWSGTLRYNYNTPPYTVSKVDINGPYGWMRANAGSNTVSHCGWAKFPLNSFIGAAINVSQESCRFTFDLGYSPSVGSPNIPFYLGFPMVDVDPVTADAEEIDSVIRAFNPSASSFPLYYCNTYAPYCAGGQVLAMSGGTYGLQNRINQGKDFATVAIWPIVNGNNNSVTFYGFAVSTYNERPRLTFTYTLGEITTGTVKTEICAGSKVSVPFSTSGYNYPPGTVFTAQLSNSSGSFNSPVVIGTGDGTGPIIATIPASTIPGTSYKIRVVSVSPITTGTSIDNITITMPGQPATATLADTICLGSAYVFNGDSLYTAGIYTDTFPSMTACDSIVTLTLTVLQPIASHINQTICEGEVFAGYDSTGIYVDTLAGAAANGCDSIRTIELTKLLPQFTSFNQSICDGESFAGYTASGTYVDTLTNASGCDSIRTLTLTVIAHVADSITQTVCFGITVGQHPTSGVYVDTFPSSAGCDSVRTLFLTVLPESKTDEQTAICAGDSYMGHTQTGIYRDTFTNADGCDSVFTLDLTVNDLPAPVITQNNDSLFTGNFESYQWLLNGTEIQGATQSSLAALQNGDYHVIVTDAEGCTDTSGTWNVTGVSIESTLVNPSATRVYPNPNNGSFTIENNSNEILEIGIYDMQGKLLHVLRMKAINQKIETDLPTGIYVLKTATANVVSYQKVVVER